MYLFYIYMYFYFYIPSARYPVAYSECPLSHEEDSMPHVRLEDISETEDVYCFRSGGKIIPPQVYMMLLTTDKKSK